MQSSQRKQLRNCASVLAIQFFHNFHSINSSQLQAARSHVILSIPPDPHIPSPAFWKLQNTALSSPSQSCLYQISFTMSSPKGQGGTSPHPIFPHNSHNILTSPNSGHNNPLPPPTIPNKKTIRRRTHPPHKLLLPTPRRTSEIQRVFKEY